MKKFLVLLILVVAGGTYGDALNTTSDNVKEKFISALGDGPTGRGAAHSVCAYKDVGLSASDIDTLNATPVEVIPAPGAGKATIMCGLAYWMNYGGTAWAGSSQNIDLIYGTSGQQIATIKEAFVENTTDSYGWSNPDELTEGQGAENMAVYAKADADFTTGNSPISMRIYYRTIGGSLILGSSLLP